MTQLISLIVPCYNESRSIDVFTATIMPFLESIPDTRWEIICIDDGSQDDTLQKITALTKQSPIFRAIELSRNFGKEAALTAGLDASRGDAVIPIDVDLQDPPELLAEMVEAWRKGAEVVVARRIDRTADSFLKRLSANAFYKFHNAISKIKIPENVGDFRLIDRSVVEALKQFPERQRFMKGLFSWVGFRTVTIDYVRPVRCAGDSKFSALSLWNLAMEGVTSFSTVPLRIWTYIGGIGAVLALLYGGLILTRTLIIGNPVPGYTSLFVAVTFFGSVQLISIGLLGEYIGRIYMETKCRPTYIIRRIYDSENKNTTEDHKPSKI
ncbi:glycosyltransferase family 2 protein [Acetobacter papayae]|uniref:glycosyltransferase family 2 protein n=1 Tax=Acetobacter papayae TaxID=1076592 RepID=UPI00046F3899|nr:glycosyltransferase family 2 protein [Acetobacter papayae]